MSEPRTRATVGSTIFSGTRCSGCNASYAACTKRVQTPGGRACCGDCYYDSTHDEQEVMARTPGLLTVTEARRCLALCDRDHGGSSNAATVYGHPGSVRVCIRIHGSSTWVYDPGWEQ